MAPFDLDIVGPTTFDNTGCDVVFSAIAYQGPTPLTIQASRGNFHWDITPYAAKLDPNDPTIMALRTTVRATTSLDLIIPANLYSQLETVTQQMMIRFLIVRRVNIC